MGETKEGLLRNPGNTLEVKNNKDGEIEKQEFLGTTSDIKWKKTQRKRKRVERKKTQKQEPDCAHKRSCREGVC